jgi:hypothetical protein
MLNLLRVVKRGGFIEGHCPLNVAVGYLLVKDTSSKGARCAWSFIPNFEEEF